MKNPEQTMNRTVVARKPHAPCGLRRCEALCCVAVPRQCHQIACVASPCIQPRGARNATPRTFTTGC